MANQYPNLTRAATRLGVIFGVFVIVLVLGRGCMMTSIDAGEAGVKYSAISGTDLTEVYGEGLHVHAPWSRIVPYDVRVQENLEQISALSSNGLTITMDVSVRYHPVRDELPALHTTVGQDYYRTIVMAELRSVAREVVGLFTPEELYSSKRTQLQEQIEEQVRTSAEEKFIEIDAVLIRDVGLPAQISQAIERKLQEQQEAERYQFTIEKERLEAERKQIEATGEAEYQRIITASLSPQFLRFKGIEATLDLAQSSNSKVVVVGGGEGGLPLILGDQ